MTYAELRELAERIKRPPHNWTPDLIWNAYAAIEVDHPKVHRAERHTVTDLVSLIRFTLGQDNELVPYAETVQQRYAGWLLQQEQAGVEFTERQRWWLDRIADVIAQSAGITADDLDNAPFTERGGIDGASRDLGAFRGSAPRPTQCRTHGMTAKPLWPVVALAEVADTALGKMLDAGRPKGAVETSGTCAT